MNKKIIAELMLIAIAVTVISGCTSVPATTTTSTMPNIISENSFDSSLNDAASAMDELNDTAVDEASDELDSVVSDME